MKKIGILFGQENSFPPAVVERINSKNVSGVIAEALMVDKVVQGEAMDYAVIVDRISHDVPFYRGMLKNAAICGTAVIHSGTAQTKNFSITVLQLKLVYLFQKLFCCPATYIHRIPMPIHSGILKCLSTGKAFLDTLVFRLT